MSYPDPGDQQEYETTAAVIQVKAGPAHLCIQGVRESLPPLCAGGPELTNWDWAATPETEERGGVRWGEYRVRGTYAGGRFTLTATPAPDEPGDDEPDDEPRDRPGIPCPEPEGGWVAPDPTNVEDTHPLISAAKAEPDFGGIWITDLEPPRDDGYQDKGKAVFTVTFTGDLARHEAELRPLWGGPLCIAHAAVAKTTLDAVLARIQADVAQGTLDSLEVTGWGSDESENWIQVHLVVAPDGTDAVEEQLAERYGVPVDVNTALRPVG